MIRPLHVKLLAALIILVLPIPGNAQSEQPANVHWAYSSYFGTGWYSVEGDRDVFVVRVTPQWELAEPSLEDGERRLGWYLRAPVSAGLDQFDVDDIADSADLDNVSFLAITPGIEAEIPVNDIWDLRPYLSIGYGQALGASESAWTYWTGVKSRVTLNSGPRGTWHLVNNLGYVGYTPNEGSSDKFWPFMTGLEVSHPFGDVTASGSQWLFHWNMKYTYFGDDIVFGRTPSSTAEITDQWEIGAAFGKRDDPVKIWFLGFDRLGMGYRRSTSGDLEGITFIFRSSFEK